MKDIYKLFYRGNLPHIIPEKTPIFITNHLDFQFPVNLKQKLLEKKIILSKQTRFSKKEVYNFEFKIFEDFDNFLANNTKSPMWLSDHKLAQIVFDSLLFGNSKYYKLHCLCIMPNHVHVLLTTINKSDEVPHSLSYIMQNHKRYTARECNKILKQKGKFWHREYFDHFCRSDEEFYAILWYII